ncbi:ABC transporter permease [Bacillus sp. V3-13]|uniref:ABC transporter permease n=1 Tax=Bacillus sp. V3-13 TaxID=2053728 RepID=UPI0015E0643D|nr:ABC transporter permease [Bacillus sp. V3-13]
MRKNRARIFLIIISISICLSTVATLLNTKELFSRAVAHTDRQQDSVISLYTNVFQQELPDLTKIEGINDAEARFKSRGRVEINGSLKNFELIDLPGNLQGTNHRPGIFLEKTTMDFYDLEKGDMIAIKLPEKKEADLPVAGEITDYTFIPTKFSGFGRAFISPASLDTLDLSSDKNVIQITVKSDDYQKNGSAIIENTKNLLNAEGITVYRSEYTQQSLLLREQMTDTVFSLLIILGVLALILAIILVIHFFYRLTTEKIHDMSILKVLGAGRKYLWNEFIVSLGFMGSCIFFLTSLSSAGLSYYFSKYLIESLNMGEFEYYYSKDILILVVVLSFLIPFISAFVPINIVLRIPIIQGLLYGSKEFRKKGGSKATGFRFFLLSVRNAVSRKVQLLTNILILAFGGAIIISCIALNSSMVSTLKEIQSFWQHDAEWNIRTNLSSLQVTELVKQTEGVLQAESWTGRSAEAILPNEDTVSSTLLLAVPRESNMLNPEVTKGLWLNTLPKNNIVVNKDFQAIAGNIQPGNQISLKIGNQVKNWTVGGVVKGHLNGPAIYIGADDYHDWISEQQPNKVMVKMNSHGNSKTISNIEQQFSDHQIAIESFDTVDHMNQRPHEIISLVVYSLLFTGVLFTAVGIMNLITVMSANVLERKQEIGIIRAIGGSDLKVFQLFIGEGLFIAIISWLISAALSYPIEKILNKSIGESLIHSQLQSQFSPWGLCLWLALSISLGVIASVVPARKAAGLPVKDLITEKLGGGQ